MAGPACELFQGREGVQVPARKNRLGCSDSGRLKGTCQGSFVALSGVPPFQTCLIMLVSVSAEACARLQIARAGVSKQLIVKLEKKMGTFFRGSYSNAVSFPPTPPSSVDLTFVLFPHKKCMRNPEPFPLAVPASPSLLGLFGLVKMCPVYENEIATAGWCGATRFDTKSRER